MESADGVTNEKRKSRRSEDRLIIGGLIVFCGAFALFAPTSIIGLMSTGFHLHETSPIPFDRAVWMEAERRDDQKAPAEAANRRIKLYSESIRQKMIVDLVRRHKLIGKTRTEITDLLGADSERWGPENLNYVVGPNGIADDMWLTFEFKDGKVSNWYVWGD